MSCVVACATKSTATVAPRTEVPLERFSAAWREAYVTGATERERRGDDHCVFCELAELEPSVDSGVIWKGPLSFVCLNAFPYGSGHLLVLPRRHVGELEMLTAAEATEVFEALRQAAAALRTAYHPDGMNVGINIGRAAGAGIPDHLHAHVLARWNGDTNFMATIAETRVLPESLSTTWRKVTDAWAPSQPRQ
jgi:ATP adenylyltransferase